METFRSRNCLIFLLVSSTFWMTSCATKEERFEGTWSVSKDNSVHAIINLQGDSIVFYDYTAFLCDTFITKDLELGTRDKNITLNRFTAKIEFDGQTTDLRIDLRSDTAGEICINQDCLSIARMQDVPRSAPSSANVLINGWKREMAQEIIGSQREYDRLSSLGQLSENAIGVITYLDSARDHLLDHFGISYDEVACWHRVDSILAYRYPTEILIGEPHSPKDSRFSGKSIRNTLFIYLNNLDHKNGIEIVFPEYNSSGLIAKNLEGQIELWENMKFYQRPLGRVLSELNTLKMKIAQLEVITARTVVTR